MDLMDAIRGRRSIRKYKPDPVPEEVLRTLLEAVRWSPSWAFLILRACGHSSTATVQCSLMKWPVPWMSKKTTACTTRIAKIKQNEGRECNRKRRDPARPMT